MSQGNGTPICWVRSPNWIMLHATYLMIAPFVGGLTVYQAAGKLPSFSFWPLHVPVNYVTLPEGVNLFPFKASLALEGRMQKTKHHLVKSLTFCVNHRWCDVIIYYWMRIFIEFYSGTHSYYIVMVPIFHMYSPRNPIIWQCMIWVVHRCIPLGAMCMLGPIQNRIVKDTMEVYRFPFEAFLHVSINCLRLLCKKMFFVTIWAWLWFSTTKIIWDTKPNLQPKQEN